MKTTQLAVISMVHQLNECIENRKANEKVEKELKAVLKELMGTDMTLEAGDLMVVVEERSRTDVDKKALLAIVGPDVVAQCSKSTTYDIISIKTMARG